MAFSSELLYMHYKWIVSYLLELFYCIQAQGTEGEDAQFTVSKRESTDSGGHSVTLQHGEQYLSVTEEKVELSSESTTLKVVEGDGGCVSFESSQSEGHYISVQEDGSVQSGTEVGASTFFTVASAVKKEEPAPAQEQEAQPAKEEEKTIEEGEEEAEKKEEEEEGGEEAKSEEPTVENNKEEEQQETPSES